MAKDKKAAIAKIALEQGLPLQETKQKWIKGWEGKPKGLLQVLWERGFINTSAASCGIRKCTLNGQQGKFGVANKMLSFKMLMSNCLDFEEEETLLQLMGREMGVLWLGSS